MKKHKAPPPAAKHHQLPNEICELLQANGVHTKDLLLGVASDMNNELAYKPCWFALDAKGLYAAYGEELPRTARGDFTPRYRLERLECIPLREIDQLQIERYVSTGRLLLQHGDELRPLVRFSIGLCGAFQLLCDCFGALKEGRDPAPYLLAPPTTNACPRCQLPLPPGRSLCPKCTKHSGIVPRLAKLFANYWKQVAASLALTVVSSGIYAVLPKLSTQVLFDQVLRADSPTPLPERTAALLTLVLSLLGLNTLMKLLNVGQDVLQAHISPWVLFDLKRKIFAAMQHLSLRFFSSKQTGHLMERVLTDARDIYHFFLNALPGALTSLLQFGFALVMLFSLHWQLALLSLFVIVPIAATLPRFFRLFRATYHRSWVANTHVTNLVNDNVNGLRIIKAFAQEERESQRFAATCQTLMEANKAATRTQSRLTLLQALLTHVLVTGLLLLGARAVLHAQLEVGALLTFMIYLQMLQAPLGFMSSFSDQWAHCRDAAGRVFEVIDSETDLPEPDPAVPLPEVQGAVELRDVEFEYEPARPVIHKVSLAVQPGQMLGIVGKTGTGKTTLANLISRLYDVKAGSVFIDGVDVKQLSSQTLRQAIGLVSQDIFLFSGSIADNIRYAKPDAPLDEVLRAAKAAAAHDFILRLPDGYDTRVGNGGQDLSGGQRQRISIARAILQNPKILILDEATAAMDTATERQIQTSLQGLKVGRTTIAIAHRLSTLRDADVLAVLDNGKRVEFGSFKDLLRQKGAFFALWQVQQQAMSQMGVD